MRVVIAGLIAGLWLVSGCTIKEDCVDCHIDVPIPDCVIIDLDASSLRRCPDASAAEEAGAE